MRILFVTPHMPHPTQGGAAIRNWHLIHAASKAGHIVHLLTPDAFREGLDAPVQPLALPAYRRTPARRIRDLLLPRTPDLARRLGAHRLRPEIARRVREGAYDLIQIEGLEMWPSLPHTDIPVIYDAHNAEATLQARMARQAWRDRRFIHAAYSALQSRKLCRYEAGVMYRVRTTLAVSESDAAHLRALAPNMPVEVVPIGVETAYYTPSAACAPIPRADVVFTGTFDYRANEDAAVWFAYHGWPRIRDEKPDARVLFVGRNPSTRMRALDGRDGITVTGPVPDDRPSMAAAAVYAIPMRFGAGVRVKLLNAMSMGCAVVATPAACEGIDVADGEDIVIAAPDPTIFAASVLALLDDPERRIALGRAARARAVAHHDWSVCTPPLLSLYAELERGDG